MSQAKGVIAKLARHGAAALKPRKVAVAPGGLNPWRRPLISRREAAVARKQAKRAGLYGTFDPATGGWLEEWDPSPEPRALRPPKAHKRERTRRAPASDPRRRRRQRSSAATRRRRRSSAATGRGDAAAAARIVSRSSRDDAAAAARIVPRRRPRPPGSSAATGRGDASAPAHIVRGAASSRRRLSQNAQPRRRRALPKHRAEPRGHVGENRRVPENGPGAEADAGRGDADQTTHAATQVACNFLTLLRDRRLDAPMS